MKKLSLNKEVVASLSSKEMNGVKGLTGQTCAGETCAQSCDTCPYPTVAPWETCPACVVTEDCTKL